MKKYAILLLFILINMSYSQDNSDPSPLMFDFRDPNTGTMVNDSMKIGYFPNDEFVIGWQWGAHPKISKELQTNMAQSTSWEGFKDVPSTDHEMKAVVGDLSSIPFDGQSVLLEPTLQIGIAGEFNVRDNAIFGFKDVEGEIISNTADPNYSRLVLKVDSLINFPSDSIVLKNAWNTDNFFRRDINNNNPTLDDTLLTKDWNGYLWYLTINLRRLDTLTTHTATNDTILSIDLPYKYYDIVLGDTVFSSRSISFASSPNLDSVETIDYYNFRGYSYRNNYYNETKRDSKIYITDNMLPVPQDTLGNDITLSFYFYTTNKLDIHDIYNHPFPREHGEPINFQTDVKDNEIYDLDVQVKYHGIEDVAINYIRIENPLARDTYFGKYDQAIKDDQQKIFNHFDTTDNFKFFRVYTQGGNDGAVFWNWGMQRYVGKLFNFLSLNSMPPLYTALRNYYIPTSDLWTTGNNFRGAGSTIGNPYWELTVAEPTIRMSHNFHPAGSILGHKWYSLLNESGNITPDTLNSFYETSFLRIERDSLGNWVYNTKPMLPTDTTFLQELRELPFNDFYTHLSILTTATLAKLELQSINHFYGDSEHIFSGKPWWAQLFPVSNWGANYYGEFSNPYVPTVDSDYHLPHTGEQIRYMINSSIIYGAKGLAYDRQGSYYDYPNGNESIATKDAFFKTGTLAAIGVTTGSPDSVNSSLTGLDYLNQDGLGGDFMNETHEANNINYYIEFDSLAQYMNVPTNRIFLGRKSQRLEMYKNHTWINENSDELMELDLVAGYLKSFREYYNQHPSFVEDSLLWKFISIDSSKLKVFNLPKSVFNNPKPIEPYIDSAFFDITLLKNKNIPLDSVFYIGVQNRRTDPLIRYTNPLNSSDKYLRFLTTSELDEYCINGGEGQSASYWQNYYWKRLGTRELKIPFNYIYSDTNDYKLLRVTELNSESSVLDTAWFFNPPFNDRVRDTVIGQDRSLSLRLLPGQGKILKVEVLKPDIVEGFLDNYNQTNLIGYPDPMDSTMITYHLVLYKNSKRPDDTTEIYKEVHYLQSIPIKKNSPTENIIWNEATRKNLSKDYLERQDPIKYNDCNHPAIVIRKDAIGNNIAYVVYTCKDSSASYNDSARVVEAKVNINGGIILSNQEIAKLSYNDIERFGTPTINASANGNYIAWTDSIYGLMIAYQQPEMNIPNIIDTISGNAFNPMWGGSMLFPSFNTYSHLENGENNAGLVWYQGLPIDQKGVFYSRIFYDQINDSLITMIPKNIDGYAGFTFNGDSSMIRLATTLKETKPIIYRSLSDYSLNPAWCINNRYDNINWIDSIYFYLPPPWWYSFSYSTIKSLTMTYQDTFHIPKKWKPSSINTYSFGWIFSDSPITSINSAQQDGVIIDTSEVLIGGSYNLDFTINSSDIYQLPGYNNSINLGESASGKPKLDYNRNKARKAAVGSQVQLAKTLSPNFKEYSNMWKNRRVFETGEKDELDNPIIKSSAKLFYKSTINEVENHGFFGFSGGNNNIFFDLPKLEGDLNEISSISTEFETMQPLDPCLFINFTDIRRDTLSTGILGLIDSDSDGDMEMEISMYGMKNHEVKVFLQRMLDSSLTELIMPPGSAYPNNSTKLVYTVIDSLNNQFKLVYVNNDTTSHFSEKSFIGGMESNDTLSFKSANNGNSVKYIIDFNNGTNYKANETSKLQLVVYPNPTNGKVQVQSILPEGVKQYKNSHRNITVGVYSTTGKLLYEKIGNTGQIIEFDMSSSPTGSYIINASYEDDINKLKGMEKLIKE